MKYMNFICLNLRAKITSIILVFASVVLAQDAKTLASSYYFKAEQNYNINQNKEALDNLSKSEKALGKTNSSIEYLRTKVFMQIATNSNELSDWVSAKQHNKSFFDITIKGSIPDEFYNEMVVAITTIEERIGSKQKEQERKIKEEQERVIKENNEKIKQEQLKKLAIEDQKRKEKEKAFKQQKDELNEESNWERARDKRKFELLMGYIEKYPAGKFKNNALLLLDSLKQEYIVKSRMFDDDLFNHEFSYRPFANKKSLTSDVFQHYLFVYYKDGRSELVYVTSKKKLKSLEEYYNISKIISNEKYYGSWRIIGDILEFKMEKFGIIKLHLQYNSDFDYHLIVSSTPQGHQGLTSSILWSNDLHAYLEMEINKLKQEGNTSSIIERLYFAKTCFPNNNYFNNELRNYLSVNQPQNSKQSNQKKPNSISIDSVNSIYKAKINQVCTITDENNNKICTMLVPGNIVQVYKENTYNLLIKYNDCIGFISKTECEKIK